MFWWIFFHGINPNFPQLSLRFSTLDTHWQAFVPSWRGRCSCSPVAMRYKEPPMFCEHWMHTAYKFWIFRFLTWKKNPMPTGTNTHISHTNYVSSTYRWTSTAPARRSLKVDKVGFTKLKGWGHVTSPRPQRPYQLWRWFEIVVNQVKSTFCQYHAPAK